MAAGLLVWCTAITLIADKPDASFPAALVSIYVSTTGDVIFDQHIFFQIIFFSSAPIFFIDNFFFNVTARVPEEGHAPGDRAREGGRGETAAVS